MIFSVCIVCTIFAVLGASDQIHDNSKVLVLTDANFDECLQKHPFVVVKFYATWCKYCKAIAKDYADLAEEFAANNSVVKFAELEATEHTNASRKYGIEQFPTLKFFSNGTVFDYKGHHNKSMLKDWLLRKGDCPTVLINTIEELEDLKMQHDVLIVGMYKDKNGTYDIFKEVALTMNDDIVFGLIRNESVMDAVTGKNGQITSFMRFENTHADMAGDFDKDALEAFIKKNNLPPVTEFTPDVAKKIFAYKSNLILFVGKSFEKYDEILAEFKKAAMDFRGIVPFVFINTDDEEHERIVDYFELTQNDLPALRLIELNNDMLKFRYDYPQVKAENIATFVNDYLNGKLKPHYRSQALPDDWNSNPVKIVVRSNFNEIINTGKTVLVEFYAPWCGHCKLLSPVYESLASYFSPRDDIIIAKMDATLNELDDIKIHSFPTIKLFRKDKKIIDYGGARTFESLKKFVESEGEEERTISGMDEGDGEFPEDETHKSHEEL